MSAPACMCFERALCLGRQQRAAAQKSLWCQCSASFRVKKLQLLSQQANLIICLVVRRMKDQLRSVLLAW